MEEIFINVATGERTAVVLSDNEIAKRVEAQSIYERDVLPLEQLKALRTRRNQLLAETDYLGLPDLGGFSAEMTAYRQALRDLPANTTDPANPVWPTKPGG